MINAALKDRNALTAIATFLSAEKKNAEPTLTATRAEHVRQVPNAYRKAFANVTLKNASIVAALLTDRRVSTALVTFRNATDGNAAKI